MQGPNTEFFLTFYSDAIWADVDNAKAELDRDDFKEFFTHSIFINPNNNSI